MFNQIDIINRTITKKKVSSIRELSVGSLEIKIKTAEVRKLEKLKSIHFDLQQQIEL